MSDNQKYCPFCKDVPLGLMLDKKTNQPHMYALSECNNKLTNYLGEKGIFALGFKCLKCNYVALVALEEEDLKKYEIAN